jgi:hypothetical protein
MGLSVGPDDPAFEDVVDLAYNIIKIQPQETHQNFLIGENCKDEATYLANYAVKIWEHMHNPKPAPGRH